MQNNTFSLSLLLLTTCHRRFLQPQATWIHDLQRLGLASCLITPPSFCNIKPHPGQRKLSRDSRAAHRGAFEVTGRRDFSWPPSWMSSRTRGRCSYLSWKAAIVENMIPESVAPSSAYNIHTMHCSDLTYSVLLMTDNEPGLCSGNPKAVSN